MRNPLWLWVFVILVRAPLLMPLYWMAEIGRACERAEDWLGGKMPGLQRFKKERPNGR